MKREKEDGGEKAKEMMSGENGDGDASRLC
jgi:hypothetical protein